jgi:hypothetical protein
MLNLRAMIVWTAAVWVAAMITLAVRHGQL